MSAALLLNLCAVVDIESDDTLILVLGGMVEGVESEADPESANRRLRGALYILQRFPHIVPIASALFRDAVLIVSSTSSVESVRVTAAEVLRSLPESC